MVQETWTTIAVPILEQVLASETGEPDDRTPAIWAAQEDKAVQFQLAALIEDGYLDGAGVHWALGRSDPIVVAGALRLTPKGRRAVGQWPDGESGDVLIRALEAAMMNLPPGETRSRVGKLLDAAKGVGTEVLSSVVSSVVKGTMGLP